MEDLFNESELELLERAYSELYSLGLESEKDGVQIWVPTWSSLLLEEKVKSYLAHSDGKLKMWFLGFWKLLDQRNVLFDQILTNFIKAIVVLCFSQYRTAYEKDDFLWMTELLDSDHLPAQAYLAAYSLPEELFEKYTSVILESLNGTEFFKEVKDMI